MPDSQSSIVRAGAHTYFFDIERTKEGKPYLRITESKYTGDGKERERRSIAIFPEYAEKVRSALSDTVARLLTA